MWFGGKVSVSTQPATAGIGWIFRQLASVPHERSGCYTLLIDLSTSAFDKPAVLFEPQLLITNQPSQLWGHKWQ